MPSASLSLWHTVRADSLNEIEAAHAAVGGAARGRRYATEQINHAYAVLLSSQFQGFCRDLHQESAQILVAATLPSLIQPVLEEGLLRDRKLDRGNPNPGNIGSDFGRFDINFWNDVYTLDQRNRQRRVSLDLLNDWRNAIAHQDFSRLSATVVQLRHVRQWRSACDGLANCFDRVLYKQLSILTARPPW